MSSACGSVSLSLPCLFSLIPDASCCLSKTFAADLRRYRVAGLGHGSPIGRRRPEASAVAEYPGCLFNGAL